MTNPDAQGLSTAGAAAVLASEGYNDLPVDAPRSVWRLLRDVLSEPMFALLLAAAVVYAVVGDHAGALVLCAFATVSILITVIQEGRSQRVLDALRDLSSPRALVLRDGVPVRVPGREVVRGDVLILAEGDRVAADGELRVATGMELDESLLTGESLPVAKQVDAGTPARVYSGALVVRGHGRAVVTATGAHSEMGRIGAALKATPLAVPRLQTQINRLVRWLGLAGLLVSLGVVALLGFVQGKWLDGLLGGIAVGMSMLPEEFPLVLTVFMVMGAWRLSTSRVLTRRASAIEALGAATVLCTDKTGTLTLNRISVRAVAAGAARWIPGQGESALRSDAALSVVLRDAQRASVLAAYDPIDSAVLAAPQVEPAATAPALRDYPMQPGRPLMGRAGRDAVSGDLWVAVKGAPESVVALCGMSPEDRQRVLDDVATLAREGARVLAVASSTVASAEPPGQLEDAGLAYRGLVAFADPLRETVPAAVRECREAGIRVVMITGDHPDTARAIGREAGLEDGDILQGSDLEALDDAELARRAKTASVYARISPGQKLRIVEALKASGEVVAMTGDGVNDAPALKAADIGIAMGARGSDVAREAASLVLLDDDFGAIVRAVRVGRRIYDNLRKAMVYILAVHVPIAGLALLPLLLGQPMLLTPMIVALLEIVIDPACSIVLEAEPEEPDVMKRPPRHPQAPLFGPRIARWSLLQGALALATVLACLAWTRQDAVSPERLRSVALLALTAVNLVLIYIDRNLRSGDVKGHTPGNPSFRIALALVAVLMAAVLGWPPLRGFMNLGAPAAGDLLRVAATSAVLLAVLYVLRRVRSPSASR